MEDLGPVVKYQEFRARMVLAGFEPHGYTGFSLLRERMFPNWKEVRRAAKQSRIVQVKMGIQPPDTGR